MRNSFKIKKEEELADLKGEGPRRIPCFVFGRDRGKTVGDGRY